MLQSTLAEIADIEWVETESPELRADDFTRDLKPRARIEDGRELPLAYGERPAPVIDLYSFANDRKRLTGHVHKVKSDAFSRRPADSLTSDRWAVSGKDDRAQAMNAGWVEGFAGIRAANAQRATPDLEELCTKVGDGMKG